MAARIADTLRTWASDPKVWVLVFATLVGAVVAWTQLGTQVTATANGLATVEGEVSVLQATTVKAEDLGKVEKRLGTIEEDMKGVTRSLGKIEGRLGIPPDHPGRPGQGKG